MSSWAALAGSDFDGGLQRSRLEAGRVPVSQGGRMTVVLSASDDLRAWAASLSDGETLDRGRKHPSKPLSLYLPGNGRCVRLETGYRDPGQTERGVRAMLAAAAHRRRTGVMVLGVAHALFDRLWARAADGPAPDTMTPDAPVAPDESGGLGRQLDANPNLFVPASLRAAFVGDAPCIERVRQLIVLASRGDYPVLVEGETGTGKEIVARQIHELGRHPTESFVAVNCGGISEHLLESELFGHVQGAFTGAVRDKVGLWKRADRGTLFLDEIGDMSAYHQVKVLRALEDGCFRPVGGEDEVRSRARVVAATHRNLRRLVEEGRFREDLYYRLFALRIRTPALREHPDDVPSLARHLWKRVTRDAAPPLPDTVLGALQRQPWPGNARELRAFLDSLAAFADGRAVTLALVRALLAERGRVG